MANRIGERYRCVDPDCGCEVEIVRPCGGMEEDRRTTSGAGTGTLRSSTLSTPPSAVSIPKESPGIQEGAGERSTSYGSPKIDEGGERGPFRNEEETAEGVSTAIESGSSIGNMLGSLICFCGSEMTLAGGRSRSASAGAD